MTLTEENSNNHEHLLAPVSTIDDGATRRTQRTSSIITLMEPVLLAIEAAEDADDDTTMTSKSFALTGILCSLLGCLLFVAGSFFTKELQIGLLDVLITRFIIQICLFGAFVVYQHYPIWKGSAKEKWLQFVLWILNGFIFFGYYIGFRYLSLPDLTTLSFTRLIWTVAFGILIYKEKPTVAILIAVCFTLIGVIFVAQLTFLFKDKRVSEIARNVTPAVANATDTTHTYSLDDRAIGISLALSTGLLSAFNLLIFKQLITLKLKPSVLVLQHSFVFFLCLILNQIYKCFILNDVTLFTLNIFQWRYWLSALISMLQTLAIIFGNRAVKRDPPSVVTIVSAADIIYAILLQNLFTRNKSNRWALIGSALVVSSVFLIGIQKFVQERMTKKKKKIKKSNEVKK